MSSVQQIPKNVHSRDNDNDNRDYFSATVRRLGDNILVDCESYSPHGPFPRTLVRVCLQQPQEYEFFSSHKSFQKADEDQSGWSFNSNFVQYGAICVAVHNNLYDMAMLGHMIKNLVGEQINVPAKKPSQSLSFPALTHQSYLAVLLSPGTRLFRWQDVGAIKMGNYVFEESRSEDLGHHTAGYMVRSGTQIVQIQVSSLLEAVFGSVNLNPVFPTISPIIPKLAIDLMFKLEKKHYIKPIHTSNPTSKQIYTSKPQRVPEVTQVPEVPEVPQVHEVPQVPEVPKQEYLSDHVITIYDSDYTSPIYSSPIYSSPIYSSPN
jgi:hypothetical protein